MLLPVERLRSLAARSYLSVLNSPRVGRGLMAGAGFRLRREAGPQSSAIARAVSSCARDRLAAEEIAWATRIEQRRAQLAASSAEVSPGFVLDGGRQPAWAQMFDHRMPLPAPTAFLSIPPLWGRLVMRLVRELSPGSCIELGTGVGISAAYQAAGLEINGAGRLITVDAAADWRRIALEGLQALGLAGRVELRLGPIDELLETALADAAPVDFAFVDAEHQEHPTLGYLETMLPYLAPGAVVVFDDIAHPKEMRRAWRAVTRHDRVERALGIGRMGIARIA